MTVKRCGNCFYYTYISDGICWKLDINPLHYSECVCDGEYWKKDNNKYKYVNEQVFKLNETILDMAYAVELLNMQEKEIERLKEQLEGDDKR